MTVAIEAFHYCLPGFDCLWSLTFSAVDGLNLAGIAIGNGVMDMIFQEPSYAEYAYYHGLIPLGAKLQFDRDWASCLEKVRAPVLHHCGAPYWSYKALTRRK